MKRNTAKVISILGHPLLTFPLFTLIALFIYEEFYQAILHSTLILGGIFLPLILKMYLKTKNGSYTNFDISDKTQRQSWYIYALLVLLVTTIILFATEQPRTLRVSVLFALILLAISKLANFYIKSSLHVSLNIFLAFLIMSMNMMIGMVFTSCILFVAWARIVLKRHSPKEIVTGAFIGFVVGIAAFILI